MARIRSLTVKVVLLVAGFLITSSSTVADPIQIGVSLPLTGEAASYGSDYRKIYEFANKTLASSRYTLTFEDDRCAGKDAVAVAQKLATIDKVKLVLGVTCDTAFASAGSVYDRSGVTVVSTSGSIVTGDHLFHTELPSRLWAEPIYTYVAMKHKKVGIISEETVFATNFSNSLLEINENNALHLVKETFKSDEQDTKAQLLRLKNANIEGIIIVPQTEDSLFRVVKQLREINWSGPRYSTFFPGAKAFLDRAGPLSEGIIFGDFPDVMTVLNDEGKRLYKQFVVEYGQPSSGPGLFVGAIESFRAVDQAARANIPAPEYLRKTTFRGVLGDWHFGSDGFWNGYRHILKVIKDGHPIPLA